MLLVAKKVVIRIFLNICFFTRAHRDLFFLFSQVGSSEKLLAYAKTQPAITQKASSRAARLEKFCNKNHS